MSFSLRRKSLSAAMPFPGRALEIPPRCPSPPFQPIKALSPPPARHQRTKSTTAKLAAATHHNVALPGLPIPSSGGKTAASVRRTGTIDIAVFVSPPPPTLKSSLKSSSSSANIKSAKATLTAPVPAPPRRTASYGSQSPTAPNFSLPSSLRSSEKASSMVSSSGPSSPTTQASFLGVPIVPRSSLDSLINTGRHRRMTTSEVRV